MIATFIKMVPQKTGKCYILIQIWTIKDCKKQLSRGIVCFNIVHKEF